MPGTTYTPSAPQDGTPISRAWAKTYPSGMRVSLGVSLSPSMHPLWIGCETDGLNPNNAADVARLDKVLETCVSADIPGGNAAAALAWIKGEESQLVTNLKRLAKYQSLAIPTPVFGDEVLSMTAGVVDQYVVAVKILAPTLQQ